MIDRHLPEGVDDVAFPYFEREVRNSSADPRVLRHVPEHVRARLPFRARRHEAWAWARDDFKGYPTESFTELWTWLRSLGVLRSPTSDERAAMAEARELTGADLPTGSDVVDVDRLREMFPAVHEELMRH